MRSDLFVLNTSYSEYIDAKRYAVIDKNNSMGLVRYYPAVAALSVLSPATTPSLRMCFSL
jgi:hypothetical protein